MKIFNRQFKGLWLTTGLFSAGLMSLSLPAQTCYDTLTETNIIDNFTILANGLVQDSNTGLMWKRCAYGQSWDATNSTCTGTAMQVTWQDALQASVGLSDGGYTDWRVPNVKELASIVEKRCVDASVNAVLFPNTAAKNFWTSTTVFDTPTWAWSVAFYNGKNNTKEKLLDLQVRFVRYAQ